MLEITILQILGAVASFLFMFIVVAFIVNKECNEIEIDQRKKDIKEIYRNIALERSITIAEVKRQIKACKAQRKMIRLAKQSATVVRLNNKVEL